MKIVSRLAVKEWLTNAKLHKRFRKSTHRKETQLKHLAFKSLKIRYLKKKALSQKTEKILKNYGFRLMKHAMFALKEMLEVRRDVIYALTQARAYNRKQTVSKTFAQLKKYSEWRAWSRFAVSEFKKQKVTENKRIIFNRLVKNLHKQRLITKIRPL